jgi:hypothetical protein
MVVALALALPVQAADDAKKAKKAKKKQKPIAVVVVKTEGDAKDGALVAKAFEGKKGKTPKKGKAFEGEKSFKISEQTSIVKLTGTKKTGGVKEEKASLSDLKKDTQVQLTADGDKVTKIAFKEAKKKKKNQ